MRRLAFAAFPFSAALFLAHYALPQSWLVPAACFCVLCAALALSGLVLRGTLRRRALVIMLALAAAFVWRFAYNALVVAPAAHMTGKTVTTAAVVADYPVNSQYGNRVDVKLRPDGGPAVGARLYYYKDLTLVPGDTVEFTALFNQTAVKDGNWSYDYLSSRGIFLNARQISNLTVTKQHSGLSRFPQRMSREVSDMLQKLFPEDVQPFMLALLTGTRDMLYENEMMSAAIAVSGISHVVAISGMHVSFLMGFLGTFIRRKRIFAAAALPVLLFFMAMTGFTPSVTRAGIMQVFLIVAPLLRRETDSLTSLSAALLILLAVNPYSCGSVGLQLSFAATLGIVVITGRINGAADYALCETSAYAHPLTGPVLRFAVSSLATTIGSLALTAPLVALHFGYISLVAILTNALTLWAVSAVFSGEMLACVFGFILLPLGSAAAYIITFAARYIIYVAGLLAEIPNAAVYTSNPYIIPWLTFVYMMVIALTVMRVKARKYLIPACIAVMSLCLILILTPLSSHGGGTTLTALNVGQGQSLVVTVGDYTAVVDCGSTSGENAGAAALDYLAELGRTAVDLLVLTHFHADHVNGVEYLLSRTRVSALAIPDPDDSEALASEYAEDIIELARRRGASIIYVTETLRVSLEETGIIMYPPLGGGGENESGLSILCHGGLTALITGDMDAPGERRLLRYARLPELDVLIAGHHGSKYSTSEELLDKLRPKAAVISSGRNNYGHPSEETLARLAEYGVTVYRTDEMGNVTIGG